MTKRTAEKWRGIGWRAAILRQLAGLDQHEAAKKAGITLQTWKNLEAGRPCRDSTTFAVARAFGESPLWVLYGARSLEELSRKEARS